MKLLSDWLNTLIVLGIILVIILWFKKQNLSSYYEGFVQDSRYIYKKDDQIYDDFYIEIYDRLFLPNVDVADQIDQIVEITQAGKRSVFLDVGSGTGHTVGHLQQKGHLAFGIDRSEAMVKHASDHYPECQFKCGDANLPLTYESGSFSHVLCLGFTLYEMTPVDKLAFFQNAHQWLHPGGYLVLHVVDPAKFDTIIPGGKPPILDNPQQYSKKRITDTIIDFIDYQYKGSYTFTPATSSALLRETFTDELTQNVRQHEKTLYLDPTDQIVAALGARGFVQKGLAKMQKDPHQYLYIFQRAHDLIGYKW